jgi:predicted nucleotidyltransferase
VSVDLLERGAQALGPLLDEAVFVGGATITLWITDAGAPAPRPTKDVDIVIEVASRAEWRSFEARLREQGFAEDSDSKVMCRWRFRDRPGDDLVLDAMPSDANLMGFANRWQGASLPFAVERSLPSGAVIRAIPPPYLIATKLEAFRGRGGGDHLGSHDLEDVVLLVDGREELVGEVSTAPPDIRDHLGYECAALLDEPRFVDAIFGFLRPDMASQGRAEAVVLPRLRAIAGPSA